DLGGAIMQSILGAVLAAGYASAVGSAIAGSPDRAKITDGVQSQLQKSFGSASDVAQQHPQYADEITAAARSSFLDGAALVLLAFPGRQGERDLLARYHEEDAADAAGALRPSRPAAPAGGPR